MEIERIHVVIDGIYHRMRKDSSTPGGIFSIINEDAGGVRFALKNRGTVMEIRQIYYVLEVAKQESFSKAAHNLYVTQPTISHQIHALEEELGMKFFVRDTHKVSLTKDGRIFCEYAEKVVAAIDDLMVATGQRTKDDKTVINVGVFPMYRALGLARVIANFYASNVNLVGSITAMDNYAAHEKLQTGEIDFAVLKLRPEKRRSGFTYVPIHEECLYAMVSRKLPLADKASATVPEIAELPVITGRDDSHYYNEMKEWYDSENAPFNVAFASTNEIDTSLDMVAAGLGVTYMTATSALTSRNENVATVRVEPYQAFVNYLVYPGGRKLTGKYKVFADYLVKECGEVLKRITDATESPGEI